MPRISQKALFKPLVPDATGSVTLPLDRYFVLTVESERIPHSVVDRKDNFIVERYADLRMAQEKARRMQACWLGSLRGPRR